MLVDIQCIQFVTSPCETNLSKGLFDFMERKSSVNIATLSDFVIISIVVVEIMFFIYHVASLDHVFNR